MGGKLEIIAIWGVIALVALIAYGFLPRDDVVFSRQPLAIPGHTEAAAAD